MTRWLTIASALFAACLALTAPAQADEGRLLIVGGGLSLDNEAVYHALIDHRPAGAPGIAIIVAASGEPSGRGATFAGELMHYGVPPEEITVVELALVDDPDTPDVDESDWAANAANPVEIAKIESAGAIWFIGGDQLRLSQALVRPGGFDSPMLAMIRTRLRDGAIVGGTSAGAAAMSSQMIVRGEAFDALFGAIHNEMPGDEARARPLVLISGLRLFAPFVVDQHFAQRGRLGRLARAIMERPQAARLGIGIDEDTALLVTMADRGAQVIGRGTVTVLDGREATQSGANAMVQLDGLLLSRLHDGDGLNLNTFAVTPSATRPAASDRQIVYGGLWPSVELVRPLESERRSMDVAEFRPRGSARFEATVTEGKRRVRFTFRANRNTRYWHGENDEGWNGTLAGARLSVTNETPTR